MPKIGLQMHGSFYFGHIPSLFLIFSVKSLLKCTCSFASIFLTLISQLFGDSGKHY